MGGVLIFDLEADSGSRADDFRYTQITVACAIVLDSDACIADRGARTGHGHVSKAMKTAKRFHWWRDVSEDGRDPFHELLTLMDEAELIVAYNGLEYDFPLMKRHYARNEVRYINHRMKTLDPFSNLKRATGRWLKLDRLLMANSLPTKIADGKQAIVMWENQQRDALKEYCEADVVLLAQLVLLDSITVPDLGRFPNLVFGVASALAAVRESGSTLRFQSSQNSQNSQNLSQSQNSQNSQCLMQIRRQCAVASPGSNSSSNSSSVKGSGSGVDLAKAEAMETVDEVRGSCSDEVFAMG